MDYIEINITTPDAESAEILIADLSDWPFETFSEENRQLSAFIPETAYPPLEAEITAFLKSTGYIYELTKIEDRNWNAVWESNFDPILVDDRCLIRAPFHDEGEYEYTIEIMPKMSFGTGHHETTYLMISEMLRTDFEGKKVLDMGSGTGVLAILAAMKGAQHVDAIDIDEWAYENCRENIAVNQVDQIVTPLQGDATSLRGRSYDIILANINRNILLNDMESYVQTMQQNAKIIFSGILEPDIAAIRAKAEALNLTYLDKSVRGNWAAISLAKN